MSSSRLRVLGALALLAGGCGGGADITGAGGGKVTGAGGQTGAGGTGAVATGGTTPLAEPVRREPLAPLV